MSGMCIGVVDHTGLLCPHATAAPLVQKLFCALSRPQAPCPRHSVSPGVLSPMQSFRGTLYDPESGRHLKFLRMLIKVTADNWSSLPVPAPTPIKLQIGLIKFQEQAH